MAHDHRKYHLEMMFEELKNLKNKDGDTRGYLSLDSYEQKLLKILILEALIKYDA